jgi:hypothetical protein
MEVVVADFNISPRANRGLDPLVFKSQTVQLQMFLLILLRIIIIIIIIILFVRSFVCLFPSLH